MPLKNILVLSILIQVALSSATPRIFHSTRLAIRTSVSPSVSPSVDAPNASQGNLNNVLSTDPKPHSAITDNPSGGLKLLDSTSTLLKAPPKVIVNKVANELVQTNTTSSEESGGVKAATDPQNSTSLKGSATVVTDKTSHAVVNTKTLPDDSRVGKPTEKSTNDTFTTPKAGDSSNVPKADGIIKTAEASKASSTPEDSTAKPADGQGNLNNAAVSTKQADTSKHAAKDTTVPNTAEVHVGKSTANSDQSQGHADSSVAPTGSNHPGSQAVTPTTIEISVGKPSETSEDSAVASHPASASHAANVTHPVATPKTVEGTTDKLNANSKADHSNADAASATPVNVKTIDINVSKPKETPCEHKISPKEDPQSNTAGQPEPSNPKLFQVNIGKPNNHSESSDLHEESQHKPAATSPEAPSKAQQNPAESAKSTEGASLKKLESMPGLAADDANADADQSKSLDKLLPKDSDAAFPPNLTSIIKEPPNSNEKSNAKLLFPHSSLTLLATSLITGLLVIAT